MLVNLSFQGHLIGKWLFRFLPCWESWFTNLVKSVLQIFWRCSRNLKYKGPSSTDPTHFPTPVPTRHGAVAEVGLCTLLRSIAFEGQYSINRRGNRTPYGNKAGTDKPHLCDHLSKSNFRSMKRLYIQWLASMTLVPNFWGLVFWGFFVRRTHFLLELYFWTVY